MSDWVPVLKGWFSHNISAMHMAPSTKMQLSSNSNRVMVVVDWEDRKVNKRHTKNYCKINKEDSFLSSMFRHWLFPPNFRKHCRSWAGQWSGDVTEPWQWELVYKRDVFLDWFWLVGLSVALCQPGDPGSAPSFNSGILGLSIGECSTFLCRTQSGIWVPSVLSVAL